MMKELELKYGCNPNQKPARIFMKEGELPIEVLNGRPGYINFLDAPAGLTCLNEVAAGIPVASFSSFTNCHPFKASKKLM